MEPQIAPLVNRCLALFETFSDSPSSSQSECSKTRSHLARFKLWVGSLGAHRLFGGRSLDYRLRDSSLVRNHIISLLQELISSIVEGTQLATTDSDDKKAADDVDVHEQSEVAIILADIGHIIDCLLRLSIAIRNPGRHDQFNSRAGADTVSSYKQWDMNHIREKFNRLDDKLVDRLGMVMSRRRQYFKYREEHSKKLAHGVLNETDEGENATTIASSIPKDLKNMHNSGPSTVVDILFDNTSETSGTSYAPSNAATNELRVPNIPKEYINGPFLCPICHTLIIINDRNSWKKHVFRDLQPYVCLFDKCSLPSQIYQRRTDWVAHMKQEHWISWSCSFGCSNSFRSQESFEKHATTVHGQSFESIDLQAVLNLCRSPSDTNIIGMCPLCFDYEIKSGKSYQSHVGDHLERLALFVLPKTLYDDDNGDDDNNDDYDDHKNDANEMRPKNDDGNSSYHQESSGDENEELDEDNKRLMNERSPLPVINLRKLNSYDPRLESPQEQSESPEQIRITREERPYRRPGSRQSERFRKEDFRPISPPRDYTQTQVRVDSSRRFSNPIDIAEREYRERFRPQQQSNTEVLEPTQPPHSQNQSKNVHGVNDIASEDDASIAFLQNSKVERRGVGRMRDGEILVDVTDTKREDMLRETDRKGERE